MFKLDDNLLRELGLGDLPAQEKNRMLQHIYETLEMRVGMRLADGMSNQQLDEFERLMPLPTDTEETRKQKEQDALKWLETNFPNYKQVVADELEKLKGEIKMAAPQIMAASQQAAQATAPAPAPGLAPMDPNAGGQASQFPPQPPAQSQQPPMPQQPQPPQQPQDPYQQPPSAQPPMAA